MRERRSNFSLYPYAKAAVAFASTVFGTLLFSQIISPRSWFGQTDENEQSDKSNQNTALQKREPSLFTLELISPVEDFTLMHSYEKRDLPDDLQSSLIEGEEVGRLNLSSFNGFQNFIIRGNNAFIAQGLGGFVIADKSNPGNPVSARFAGIIWDAKLLKDEVYLANHLAGFTILNVRNITTPRVVAQYQINVGMTPPVFFVKRIFTYNNKTCLINTFSGELRVFNVANPSQITEIRKGGVRYLGGNQISDIAQFEQNLYFVSPGLGLTLMDLSTFVGAPNQTVIGLSGVASAIENYGNLTYVAARNGGLRIINSTSYNLVGTYASQNVIDVRVSEKGNDRIAYLAVSGLGLQVLNITNPSRPLLLSTYVMSNIAGLSISETKVALLDSSSNNVLWIDVSNPATPVLCGFVTGFGVAVQDVDVHGKVVYELSTSFGSGISVVDFSNPRLPILIGSAVNQRIIGGTIRFFRSGSIGYLANLEGFEILDLSNPINPLYLGQYTLEGANGFHITVSENIAYLGAGPAGLHVVDVSNLATPVLLGIYSVPNGAYAVATRGNFVYVGDGAGNMHIINTQLWISRFKMLEAPIQVATANKYTYVADAKNTLHVIDYRNPLNPKEIATYMLSGVALDMEPAGDFLYISQGTKGIEIVDISNPLSPRLAGKITKGIESAQSLAPVNNELLYVGDGSGSLIIYNIPEKLVVVNNQLTISQGQTVPITSDQIAARDTRQIGFYPAISFLVSNLTNGQFVFSNNSNQPIRQFTQQNIFDGLIQFKHAGGQATPSYFLTAIFGNLSTNLISAKINFSQIYQTPTILSNSFSVKLNSVATLNEYNINASVTNGDYPVIKYTVDNIGNGRFQRTNKPGVILTTFTQQQIINGEIQFVPFGNSTEPPFYLLSAANGPKSTEFFNGTVTLIIPSPPSLLNNQIVINQGETITLTRENIDAKSTNVNDRSLIILNVNKIKNGRFQTKNDPGTAITQFPLLAIDNGDIQFVQLGGNTDLPSYEISVSDGVLTKPYVNGTMTFIIHQAPQLDNNGFTVNQGQITKVTLNDLNATSNTVSPNLFLFYVNNIGNGRFQLTNNPGIAVTQFTYQQIGDGMVEFVQLGNGLDKPSYQASASDGQSASVFSNGVISFHATPLIKNNKLAIGNGEEVLITSDFLQAYDFDTSNSTLTFSISDLSHIKFNSKNNPINASITEFIQQNIVDGLILAKHDGSGKEPSYQVSISDGYTTLGNLTPTISFNNFNNTIVSSNTASIIGAAVGGGLGLTAMLTALSLFIKRQIDKSTRDKHRLAAYIWEELKLQGIDNFETDLGRKYVSIIENELVPALKEHNFDPDNMQDSDLKNLAKDIARVARNTITHDTTRFFKASLITVDNLSRNITNIISGLLEESISPASDSHDNYQLLEGEELSIPLQPYRPSMQLRNSGYGQV
ncbi:MAG: hypothetical protein H0T84_11385 [Tatlockia sp.]|nr:hypothetical protein [Tatlockia sp.]